MQVLRSKQTRVRIEQNERPKDPWQEGAHDPHEPIASEDKSLKKGEGTDAVLHAMCY